MRAVSPIRRCHPGVIAAAACWLVAVGDAQEIKADVRYEMTKAFQRSFVYNPDSPTQTKPPARDPAIILLPKVVVRNRFEAEGLDAAIAHQEAIDDRFTLYKGGTIAGPLGVWYQDDPKESTIPGRPIRGLDFLKVSW
jgi:hypothetical protein